MIREDPYLRDRGPFYPVRNRQNRPRGVPVAYPPGAYFTKAQDTDFCGQKSYFIGMSLVLLENSTVSAEPVLFG